MTPFWCSCSRVISSHGTLETRGHLCTNRISGRNADSYGPEVSVEGGKAVPKKPCWQTLESLEALEAFARSPRFPPRAAAVADQSFLSAPPESSLSSEQGPTNRFFKLRPLMSEVRPLEILFLFAAGSHTKSALLLAGSFLHLHGIAPCLYCISSTCSVSRPS
jgi:hypothetical protein